MTIFDGDVLVGVQPGNSRSQLNGAAAIPSPPKVSTAGGPAALLRRLPDIIAAERRLAASNARIGVAVSEYYPKFSLSGLLGTAAMVAGGVFGGDATQANGVLGLRWRLFDFGRVDAEIKAAKGRNAEALAAYRLTVLRASQDVEDAFSTLVQQEARAAILEQGELSLARARATSDTAYRGGVISLVDVLDADRRLLETRDGAIQARAAACRCGLSGRRHQSRRRVGPRPAPAGDARRGHTGARGRMPWRGRIVPRAGRWLGSEPGRAFDRCWCDGGQLDQLEGETYVIDCR
ncbi:TolC family protein [Sphingomonas sp. M6A6_1c]